MDGARYSKLGLAFSVSPSRGQGRDLALVLQFVAKLSHLFVFLTFYYEHFQTYRTGDRLGQRRPIYSPLGFFQQLFTLTRLVLCVSLWLISGCQKVCSTF